MGDEVTWRLSIATMSFCKTALHKCPHQTASGASAKLSQLSHYSKTEALDSPSHIWRQGPHALHCIAWSIGCVKKNVETRVEE